MWTTLVRHGRSASASQRRRTSRRRQWGLALAASLVGASLIGVDAPAGAGDGAKHLRVEAFNTNYVHVQDFGVGETVTIVTEGDGGLCDDFTLQGPDGGVNPIDLDPDCDIQAGWTVKASTDGGTTFDAVLEVQDVQITGFSATSVSVDTAAPTGASSAVYGCEKSVYVTAPGGALRWVPAADAQTVDFSVPGPCPQSEDDTTYDVSLGGEFFLNMEVLDGETRDDVTLDLRTFDPPAIVASLNDDWLNGRNFDPTTTMVEVTVFTDTSETGTELPPTMFPTNGDGTFHVDLAGQGVDLAEPMRITASPDSLGQTRTLDVVEPLSIRWDVPSGKVVGERPAGEEVDVFLFHPDDGCDELGMLASNGATWEYEPTSCALDYGLEGQVELHDDDGDTLVANSKPRATFEGIISSEEVRGSNWEPTDTAIEIGVILDGAPEPILAPTEFPVNGDGTFSVDLVAAGVNIEPPMVITATGVPSTEEKQLELVGPLSFGLDLDNNMVFGERPDQEVLIDFHTPPSDGVDECGTFVHIAPDGTNVWEFDPAPCVVTADSGGQVSVTDDDGDITGASTPTTPISQPITPGRFLDTRENGETIDGQSQGGDPIAADTEVMVQITGRGGVPDTTTGVIVNVTAVRPMGVGFLTAHPCLDPRPNTSSLNYTSGVNLGNEIVAELSDDGKLCVYTSTDTDLTIDVVGTLGGASPLIFVGPDRYLDTRQPPAGETFDGDQVGSGAVPERDVKSVPIAGRGDVPPNAAAVVMNVTAVGVADAGFVTLFPCTPEVPLSSSLNYSPGANRGNEVFARLDDSGNVCVFTSSSIDLTFDVVGYLPANTALNQLDTPVRFADTRANGETIDGESQGGGPLAAMSRLEVDIGGRAGIPEGQAASVTMNVTAVNPTGVGFVTVFTCEDEVPNASSLNFVAGVNGGNDITAGVSSDDSVCFYVSTDTELTVDVSAYSTA